jgi:Phosphorylase superfamily
MVPIRSTNRESAALTSGSCLSASGSMRQQRPLPWCSATNPIFASPRVSPAGSTRRFVADVVAPLRVRAPGGGSLDCDASVVARALRCGARRITALYSAQAIVVTAVEKRRLSARADAVDMESWAILSESRQRGIPGVAIRAISDPADVDLPLDLNRAVSPQGELNWGGVLAAMARRPTAVPWFVRLGVLGHRAATALSVFLDAYMERLAGSD